MLPRDYYRGRSGPGRSGPGSSGPARSGATTLECAIVLPVILFLLLALAVGTSGILRYQEVATLAREATRYGSTHGYQYRKDAGLSTGTRQDWTTDIITNGVNPRLVALDASKVNVTCTGRM